MPDPDYEAIRLRTKSVYERAAAGWDASRSRALFERAWLDRFLALVPAGGHILDLGCGGGEPIGAYLIEQGRRITGVDYAASMIELARARFPDHDWIVGDMRDLDLEGPFDGVVSWDGSFHLTGEEQRALIDRLGGVLRPGAPAMLTIGPVSGETEGLIEGEAVYHASLAPDDYRAAMAAAGFDGVELALEDPDCHGHSVLFAVRR
ncbi:MAG: class I SAM-dependent methyltransferase [Pseudomonadota bacterium]